jgi:hypothetical protein
VTTWANSHWPYFIVCLMCAWSAGICFTNVMQGDMMFVSGLVIMSACIAANTLMMWGKLKAVKHDRH